MRRYAALLTAGTLGLVAIGTATAGGGRLLPLDRLQQSSELPWFMPDGPMTRERLYADQRAYLHAWEAYLGQDVESEDYVSPYSANGGDRLADMYRALLRGEYDPPARSAEPETEAGPSNAPEDTPAYSPYEDYDEYRE